MSKNPENALYPTPFCPGWFRQASLKNQSLYILVCVALLLALRSVIGALFIPLNPAQTLRVGFSFLVVSLSAVISGPWLAVCSGAAGDLISYLLNPAGSFFPGYTLSAMLGGLIYALFLYRARITVVRLFLCKLCINALINVCLGSLWNSMMSGKGFLVYASVSAVKNALLLPVEVAMMVVIFRLMLPVLTKLRLAPPQPQNRIPFI